MQLRRRGTFRTVVKVAVAAVCTIALIRYAVSRDDSESGAPNGAPFLGSESSYHSWAAVLSRDGTMAGLTVADALEAALGLLQPAPVASPQPTA